MVVEDVRLRDDVREGAAKERSRVESAAREGERGATVVREVHVRVLEKSDEDERVAHSEVWHTVNGHHLREAARRRPVEEGGKPEDVTDVADDDLVALVRAEMTDDGWKRLVVVG